MIVTDWRENSWLHSLIRHQSCGGGYAHLGHLGQYYAYVLSLKSRAIFFPFTILVHIAGGDIVY
jgi:hypothetical protein